MKARVLFATCLATVTASAALCSTAHAAKPDIFHANYEDTFLDIDVCGITVDAVTAGQFTDHLLFDKNGNVVRYIGTASGSVTYTNADGDTLTSQFGQQYVDADPIIDEQAGTITFVYSYKGLPERVTTSSGGRARIRDAGFITFADTFDLETGEFISSETLVNSGPHPEADSNFELFCEVFVDALG